MNNIIVISQVFFLMLISILSFNVYSNISSMHWVLDEGTPLMVASRNGDIVKVRQFINDGIKISEKNEHGATALLFAASNGHSNIVKLLIKKGASTNDCAKYNMCPLWFAVDADSFDTVLLLLNSGADPNKARGNPQVFHVLHKAVLENRIKIVKLLIQHGVKIDAADNGSGTTALSLAVSRGYLDVLNVLISNGANAKTALQKLNYFRINFQTDSAYKVAKKKNYKKVLEAIDKALKSKKYQHLLVTAEDIIEKVYRDKTFRLESANKVIQYVSKEELRIIKNTIFARKNYKFDSKDLLIYFRAKFKKYRPLTKKVKLSKVDKINLMYVDKMEEYIMHRDSVN